MQLHYEVNGVALSYREIVDIHDYYRAYCSGVLLQDNYRKERRKLTDEEALSLGYTVRHVMNKYGYSEDEAVNKVVTENGLKHFQ